MGALLFVLILPIKTSRFCSDKTKISKEIIYLKTPQTPEQNDKLVEQQMALSEALSQSGNFVFL